jgi:hypothetical protein
VEAVSDARPRPFDVLREAVRTQGGDWTTRRVQDLFSSTDWNPTQGRARQMLNKLAEEEGVLIKHGKLGKLWTQPPQVLAEALARTPKAYVEAIRADERRRIAEENSDR